MSGADRRPIRRLDPTTVARIAAGEVVESPASVLKELVENAYDARATEVRIALSGGGIDGLKVTDDGEGILPDELSLAVERHTTSKLGDADELERVGTFGFRGEALASIGAVSRLTITSRTAGSDSATGIRIDGGTPTEAFVAGSAPGTSVEVRDLFYNTPARRKFLRSPAAEQVEAARVVGALYLARPDVALVLSSEGVEIARFPRASSLADAAVRVLGEELLAQTIELRSVRLGESEGAVSAVLARPVLSRGSSSSIYLSINGRVVSDRALQAAIRFAYDEYLPRSRFPIGVVHLELDPARVDVNVHPAKRVVRISREREIADALRRVIRLALQGAVSAADAGARPLRPFVADRALGPPPATEPLSVGLGPSLGATARPRVLGTRRLEEAVPDTVVAPKGAHPGLRLLGCLFDLYWVAESDDALLLVDQHAASERVVYDALRETGRLARQELVQPWTVTLTARQSAAWAQSRSEIEAAGYSVEPFGGSAFRVLSTPVYRGRIARADGLPELLDELADGGRSSVPDGWVERRAASIACHAAVRGGDAIPASEMGRILEALYRLPGASYSCPHGRPILVRFDRGRLDRWFLRSIA